VLAFAARGRTPSAAACRIGWRVTLAISAVTACAIVVVFIAGAAAQPDDFWLTFTSQVLIVLALAGAWMLARPDAAWNGRRVGLLAVAAVAACAIAGWQWDQRTPWTRYVESGAASHDFAGVIPQRASVYWDGGVELLWLALDRPSYFSCLQGTGALFSRGTAMAYAERRSNLFPLKELDDWDCLEPDDGVAVDPRASDLVQACQREAGLDYVILARLFPGIPSRVWSAPVPLEVTRMVDFSRVTYQTRRFYIYACADLRSPGTQAGARVPVHS
jgi:hypothetical protein